MKRVLILALLLTACSPRATPPTAPTDATAKLTVAPYGTGLALRFSSGATDALNVSLTLEGTGLKVNDAKCTASRCDLGTVPAGQTYRLPFGGTLNSARAELYRADGVLRVVVWP